MKKKKKIALLLKADDPNNLQVVYFENEKPTDATKFTKEQKQNIVSLYISAQPLIYKMMRELNAGPKVS